MANKLISDLTSDTAPNITDLIETLRDPSGSPSSRKVTLTDMIRPLFALLGYPNFNQPPSTGTWTWDNQGSATLTDNGFSQTLYVPNQATTDRRALYIAAPALNYTITACFNFTGKCVAANPPRFGVYWGDNSAQAHLITIASGADSTLSAYISKMTNVNTFTTDYVTNVKFAYTNPLWLRMTEDATNRTSYISFDGINFLQLHQIGRTNFLTATRVGWFQCPTSAGDQWATLLSWKQT